MKTDESNRGRSDDKYRWEWIIIIRPPKFLFERWWVPPEPESYFYVPKMYFYLAFWFDGTWFPRDEEQYNTYSIIFPEYSMSMNLLTDFLLRENITCAMESPHTSPRWENWLDPNFAHNNLIEKKCPPPLFRFLPILTFLSRTFCTPSCYTHCSCQRMDTSWKSWWTSRVEQ